MTPTAPLATPWRRTGGEPSEADAAAASSGAGYALLYLPVLLAWLLAPAPLVSYAVAWLGSFWIFWLSLTGRVRPLPHGVPLRDQVMRPIGFTQVVFMGYTALTSIFHVLGLVGVSVGQVVADGSLPLAAAAQRYYVLAHAAFVTGVLLLMDYRSSGTWRVKTAGSLPRWMLWAAGGAFVGVLLIEYIPGLGQVRERLQLLSLVASVMALALALPERRFGALVVAGGLFGVNMAQAFLSGWKEEIVVLFLLLGAFAYPYYRKTVLAAAPLVAIAFLLIVPAYNVMFRDLNWDGTLSEEAAARESLEMIRASDPRDLAATSWWFLTGRASEIGLFQSYLETTPRDRPFYQFEIVEQAAAMVVPRILWPDKPIVENVVMARVVENGAVDYRSDVSAKPQFVVDGYLSGGAFGVWLACLLYGLTASAASRLAERWFGGYLLGSALIYTALFRAMWRGNAFEFLLNNVVWSFVIMAALFAAGRAMGWIVPAAPERT